MKSLIAVHEIAIAVREFSHAAKRQPSAKQAKLPIFDGPMYRS
jgi:hypothetical protein